jgi:hypothetical protein
MNANIPEPQSNTLKVYLLTHHLLQDRKPKAAGRHWAHEDRACKVWMVQRLTTTKRNGEDHKDKAECWSADQQERSGGQRPRRRDVGSSLKESATAPRARLSLN